jgi:hypothetical protein
VIIAGKKVPSLRSPEIEKYCKKIIDVVGKPGQPAIDVFNKAVSVIDTLSDATDDRLKRQAITSEMLLALDSMEV